METDKKLFIGISIFNFFLSVKFFIKYFLRASSKKGEQRLFLMKLKNSRCPPFFASHKPWAGIASVRM
jgi:hypothetical protein